MTSPRSLIRPKGPDALFVGLATLDVLQQVEHVPAANEKVVALAQTAAAGGPATNAAVLHAHLGGTAHLLTGVGTHPLATGITADLRRFGVHLHDRTDNPSGVPTVSTILVTAATGERAVVSTNATAAELVPPSDLDELVRARTAVLLDGHHPALALAAARHAREHGVVTVLDGGSFKPVTQQLLAHVDVAVCSADFHPPGCATATDTLAYLHDHHVPWAAVTDGAHPVRYSGPGGSGTVPVPAVATVVDTLGAGDFFHGAFTHHIAATGGLDQAAFSAALAFAARTAARSTESFGTRDWLARPAEAAAVPHDAGRA
ncbi:PfkB family carbohydrate kinase [Streptomyces sp. NPDC055722]